MQKILIVVKKLTRGKTMNILKLGSIITRAMDTLPNDDEIVITLKRDMCEVYSYHEHIKFHPSTAEDDDLTSQIKQCLDISIKKPFIRIDP